MGLLGTEWRSPFYRDDDVYAWHDRSVAFIEGIERNCSAAVTVFHSYGFELKRRHIYV